jgi:peptide/nickel transport system permease protein
LFMAVFVRMGIMPLGGVTEWEQNLSHWSRIRAAGLHFLIPVSALVMVGLPIVLQHTCTALKEVLAAPFIQAARGHGIPSARLLLRHALPAAANPLISLFGLSLAGLIGTSLLAEIVSGWPGLGPLFVQSIFARDFYVVIAIVMLSSLLLVLGNLVGDLLLFAADPRIRRTA